MTNKTTKSTAFVSEINHRAATEHDRAKAASSLSHSLRQENTLDRKNGREWNKDDVKNSYVLIDNQKLSLSDLSEDQKEELKQDILGNTFSDFLRTENDVLEEKHKELNKKANNSRRKLKKMGGEFEAISQIKNRLIEDDEYKAAVNRIQNDESITRKNQKLKQLQTYKDLNSEIFKGQKIDKRKTAVQEFVLKFPSLENGALSQDKFIEYASDYYQDNFPDYPIKAQFFHGDETYKNEQGKEVGWHSHTFVEAKNAKTGAYDLREKQKALRMSYISSNRDKYPGLSDELLEEMKGSYSFKKNPDKKADIQLHNDKIRLFNKIEGQAKQDIFYDYFNEKLEKDGIHIEKNEYKTLEEKKRLEQMKSDSKKNKSDRDFNHENAKIDENLRTLKHQDNLKTKNDFYLNNQTEVVDKMILNSYEEYDADFQEKHEKQIQELRNHVNYDQLQEDKVFGKIVDKVERVLNDDNSLIKMAHNKLHAASSSYKEIFDTSKRFYFDKYEQITGDIHRFDTETLDDSMNLDNDLLSEFKSPDLDEIKDKIDEKYEEEKEQEEQQKDDETIEDFGDRFDEFGKYIWNDDSDDDLPEFSSSDISNQDLIDELNNDQNSGVNIQKKYDEKRRKKEMRKLTRK